MLNDVLEGSMIAIFESILSKVVEAARGTVFKREHP